MNHPFFLTLSITGLLCATALLLQSWQNRELEDRLARLEASPARTSESPVSKKRMNPDGDHVADLIAAVKDLPPSPERSLLLRKAVERGGSGILEDQDLIEGLSKIELARLMASTDPAGALKLLPKPEPPLIQGNCLNCHGESETKRGSCPRSVPLSDVTDLMAGWDIAKAIFSKNPVAGLEAFVEMGERDYSKMGRMNPVFPDLVNSGSIPIADDQVSQMAAAIENPRFERIRSEIITLTLNDAVFEGGVAAMAERANSLSLSEADLNRYMGRVIGDGSGRLSGGTRNENIDVFFAEPEATLQWVLDVRTPEAQRKMIPDMVLNWARRDANAAVNWMIDQEPSPVQDQTIATLVTRGPNIAREDAAAWALEIQDQAMRTRTVERVVGAWREEDPQAANKWLENLEQ